MDRLPIKSQPLQIADLTFGTSGFTAHQGICGSVLKINCTQQGTRMNIKRNLGNMPIKVVAQTEGTDDQGNPDHSIQFFVSTQEIVTGDLQSLLLRPDNHCP